jgi:hypothetical protein
MFKNVIVGVDERQGGRDAIALAKDSASRRPRGYPQPAAGGARALPHNLWPSLAPLSFTSAPPFRSQAPTGDVRRITDARRVLCPDAALAGPA